MDEDKILAYYDREIEKNRLDLEYFKLEGIRTQEIVSRFLHTKNMRIADIGGGAGFYAFWLQSLGHRVNLVDLSPKNIALVKEHGRTNGITLESCQLGDARKLPFADEQFDLVLMLGPLYHLIDRDDRLRALQEVRRIVKPQGVLIAAFISRYASLFDGLKRDLIRDDRFDKILADDLQSGVHRNSTENPEYFTTAFFHTPRQLEEEIREGGFKFEKMVAVEGAGWLIDGLSVKIQDERYRRKLHSILKATEDNSDLMALSPHILGIGRKDGPILT